ncbi:MAG: methionyl-tRNA formyltransferase [Gemmiger sp.]|nr:methionyl-tRNA formyltransferase [Gemmiger sp.]
MRIVFMGTPDIAAQSLQALLDAGHTICGVFTRADKPVGRKQVLTPPPVKALAVKAGIPVYQPATLRDEQSEKTLRALAPELVVVVAYGRILPPALLAIPPRGCINLHVSLLPKYRGSAPIQWAVLNGDTETGVTIMQLDEGCDTGDILLVEKVAIGPDETSGQVFDKVSKIGADTLVTAIEKLQAGTLTPQKQADALATKAPPLNKEMARFDFDLPAQKLHNLVRGMNPWPVAFFERGGKKIKVLESTLPPEALTATPANPGVILALHPLTVACGSGALQLQTLTPEGGKPMSGSAWAAGRRLQVGDSL